MHDTQTSPETICDATPKNRPSPGTNLPGPDQTCLGTQRTSIGAGRPETTSTATPTDAPSPAPGPDQTARQAQPSRVGAGRPETSSTAAPTDTPSPAPGPDHLDIDTHARSIGAGPTQTSPETIAGTTPRAFSSPGTNLPGPDHLMTDTRTRAVGAGPTQTSPETSDRATPTSSPSPGTKQPGPDHNALDTRPTFVGAGPTLYDPGLYLLAEQLNAIEDLRKATANRLRQATRNTEDKDGEVRGLGLSEDAPTVRATVNMLAGLDAIEHQVILELQRAMRRHPLSAWQKRTVGVGEKQLARLLSAIGDPYWNTLHDRPRIVSELWAYAGLHTVPAGHEAHDAQPLAANGDKPAARHPDQHRFDAQDGVVRVAARRKRGERSNWSTEAKTRAYLIAESCIKQTTSPYRAVYDGRRTVTAERVHAAPCVRCGPSGSPAATGTPWSLGHQHADGLRIVSKTLLRDLWRAARDAR